MCVRPKIRVRLQKHCRDNKGSASKSVDINKNLSDQDNKCLDYLPNLNFAKF